MSSKPHAIAAVLFAVLLLSACSTPQNHITLVDVPSGTVAGVATERGVLILKEPAIKRRDVYAISHVYGNGVVKDDARVILTDEYLALLEPLSTRLNNTRFLLFPMAPDEELYVGILDTENDPRYLEADLFEGGARGDLVTCKELENYPVPTKNGYSGIGLFAYRDALWLVGILTPMKAEIPGVSETVYTFVGLDKFWDFLPDLNDNFSRDQKPFRPDLIYGVERDGSGE
jgi:hypothetical protein